MLKIFYFILFLLIIFEFSVELNEIENCDINLAQIQNECQLKYNNIFKEIHKKTSNYELIDELNKFSEICEIINSKSDSKSVKTSDKVEFEYKIDPSVRIYEKRFDYLTKQLNANSQQLIQIIKLLTNNEKQLLEIKNELKESREELTEIRKQPNNNTVLSKESLLEMNSMKYHWIHSKIFNDSDGKQRAFIFPLNKNKINSQWIEANHICNTYNATLVEINSQQKQNILESFFKQLESNHFPWFWLNARKDSSGKWKWLRSGNDFTFTNWDSGYPTSDNVYDRIYVLSRQTYFGKWINKPKTDTNYIICELEVSLQK